MTTAIDYAIKAFLQEKHAQMGEKWTWDMHNKLEVEDPEHYSDLEHQIKAAINAFVEVALEKEVL